MKTKKGKDIHYRTPGYNYMFNLDDGTFVRWGKTIEDDPEMSVNGPEIMDIEITTICSQGCSFCYKTNTKQGENMSFETFKTMFDKFPDTLTQIAFGIGDIDANPDMMKMFRHARENDVIPNVTINGYRLNEHWINELTTVCGAVAVSHYSDAACFNAVNQLSTTARSISNSTLKQVNIHKLLSEETYDSCMKLIQQAKTDPRLIDNLNAIVFLWLKPIGGRNHFNQIKSKEKFKALIDSAIENGVAFGFDSCTASNFLQVMKGHPDYDRFEVMAEPCESCLFSYYINTEGRGYPCSFSEKIYYNGINIVKADNFLRDVWNGGETIHFRKAVLANKDENNCRMCPLYDLRFKE